ncbi:MAG: TRAP transporter large permease [Clostridiales bacterium]|nr:TRAP transporter large permease [Clostridiales bacterium]
MNNIIFFVLILMMVCFLIRLPISLTMFCVSILYFILSGMNIGQVLSIAMSRLAANSNLVSIPLFIFTANIMNSGKVTEHMFTFCKALIGRRKGALAYLNILISLIFSGMTGSAVADASGIGIMEIREMEKDGYDVPFSSAITSATSVVGPIFPPSIPMVVYALFAEVSIGRLFMGGMIPALLISLVLSGYVHYISKKRNYPEGIAFTRKEFWSYTIQAIPALMTPVILLGGIYTGVVTATEAGALAAAWSILVSICPYRCITPKQLLISVRDTVTQTGTIIAIVTGAFVLSHIVTLSGLGKAICDTFLSLTDNKYVFLVIVNILFIFLGMLFDTQVLQMVFLPLVLPVATALGIDLVHFGVVIVVNMMIGMTTPPYGVLCFISASLGKVPVQSVFKEVLPMVALMIAVLLLITYCPAIVTAIPEILMG